MIIKEYRDYSKSKKGTKKFLLKCDECGVEFISNGPKRFCTQQCYKYSAKLGVLSKQRDSTLIRKYGTRSYNNREQSKKTCMEKYGVENPAKCDNVKQKTKETCLKKYGVEYYLQSNDKKEKQIKTCQEKYNANHHMQSEIGKESFKRLFFEKYGTENPMQIKSIREKAANTCLRRHGAKTGFEIRKNRESCESKVAQIKKHKTRKKNNSYGKSKAEDRFYEFLLDHFSESIERHISINGWSIDFLIKDLYIQFDGVYYHGIDRPISVITEFKTSTDRTIYKTYLRDKEQVLWFNNNNQKLLRITDKEFEQDKMRVYNKILEKLNG